MNKWRAKEEFTLRRVRADDADKIYKLSNDEIVRSNSIHSDPISWDTHIEWFKNRILDNNCDFYLAEGDSEEFIGQIRFDKKNGHSIVSISIISSKRGLGLGELILKEGSKKHFLNHHDVERIIAYIKTENNQSQMSFKKSGFTYSHDEKINNDIYCVYVLFRI